MRTAYLGTSEFAATVLRALAASEHPPALVVTPPDSRAGRGRKPVAPPAALAARELGLELHQTGDVNETGSMERLQEAGAEEVVVCAFGQLIGEPLLEEIEMLNVHPSLIPRWRGAAPIERAIMAGDERTGVTIMRVTADLDSGPVALQEETPIGRREGYEELSARLAELGGGLLIESLDRAARGSREFTEQDDGAPTYAEKVAPEERHLDPSRPAIELERTVRALNPHIGTHVELEGGERLGVRRAEAVEAAPAAGELRIDEGLLFLGCAEGALRLDTVQPPGKRPMSAEDFLRGHEIPGRAA